MTHKITQSILLLVAVFTAITGYSQNLLTNGDFESGGNGVGFNVNSSFYSQLTQPFSGTTVPGNYAVTSNPFPMNTANFLNSTDHSGTGNMLVVDGANTGGQYFWRAGSSGGGACGLTVGLTYTFSYWIKSISSTVTGPATQAQIEIVWNNASNITRTSVNTVTGNSVVAPLPAAGWEQVVYTFRPTNACVNIEIKDNNTNIAGNDFAVDDFSLLAPPAPLALTYSITNQTCINAADGTIFGYATGGTAPYTYTLSGPSFTTVTNNNGYFTGLAPLTTGTYTLSVTDNVGAPVQQTGLNLAANPAGLNLVAASTTICAGQSTTLTATGGSTYTWSVTPNTETVPSGANPTVSPSGTATYTINSTITTPDNLIYNGDFFLGNVGFTSDYNYYNPNNPTNAQKAYGVVTNANTWEAGFAACNDHTTGTGRMLVVDGSTTNNDKVWCQTVPVIPGQNYAIRYWVQTLALPNPANIEVTINGVSMGTSLAPSTTCSWGQQSYNWNAGASTTAEICFYNRNINANGNDFALDDLTFSRTNTCVLPPKSITINVTPNNIVLNITNPNSICAPGTVDITAPAVTATSTSGTTLTYWADAAATSSPLTFVQAQAIATSGTYYIKSTLGSCSVIRPVVVTIATSASTPAPTVVTPIYLCNGSVATPVTATALPGATLNWYTAASGGTALATAPTPSTATDGLISYWVSQTIGTCESPRVRLNVFINSLTGTISMFCDNTRITTNPPTSILMDWNNLVGGNATYNYTYSINGGPAVTGSTTASSLEIFGVLPGQSATMTILSAVGYPCIASQFPMSNTCTNCASTTAPTFTLPTSICRGAAAPTLPTTSNNGISGTWSPATVSNTTGGNYDFTPDPILFPCADPFTQTIAVVNPPNPGTLSANPGINICVGGITTLSSTTTGGTWSSTNTAVATVNASTGVVTGVSAGNNVIIKYTVSGTGGCLPVDAQISINVTAPPIAGTLTGGSTAICVADTTTFTPSVPGGTWSSLQPAIASVNATSGLVTALTAGQATIRYTVAGTGGCANVFVDKVVTVSAIPSAGTLSGVQAICVAGTTNFQSTVAGGTWSISPTGIATISSTGNIVGVAAGVATVSYIVNGTGGCPASVPATRNVTVTAAPNPGTLSGGQNICQGATTVYTPTVTGGSWSSLQPNIASVHPTSGVITGLAVGQATIKYTVAGTGGCGPADVTRIINVNQNITPTFNPVAAICEGNALAPLPLTSTNGITGTWSPPLDNTVTTQYNFAPTAGLCANPTTLTITVNRREVPLFAGVTPQCQGDTPPVLPTTSNNVPPISGTWNPPTVNTASLGTTFYTFNPTAGQCVSTTLTQLPITVVPVITPNFAAIPPFCDGKTAPILSTTSPNGVEGTWNPPIINNTLPGSYLFTPTPGQCALTQTLSVSIIPRTVPDFATIPAFCKGSTPPVLSLTSPNGITGTWNPSLIDNSVSGVFPYEFTPDASECATNATLYIDVTEPISPGFPDLAFCTGSLVPALPTVSPNNISGSWSPATIDNLNSGAYLFTPDVGECAIVQTMNVTINQYTLVAIDGIVTNYFDENQVITVLATDPGNYLYQLDYGPLQQSNVFQNVSAGTHVIKVVDANGCSSPLTRDVLVINYPKFFTPNDDTYNDTWNINGLSQQLSSRIFIFDRYGKLLKEIFPSGKGWDGTYNGNPLPADDYWFSVDYQENGQSKNFKAHFSLKR